MNHGLLFPIKMHSTKCAVCDGASYVVVYPETKKRVTGQFCASRSSVPKLRLVPCLDVLTCIITGLVFVSVTHITSVYIEDECIFRRFEGDRCNEDLWFLSWRKLFMWVIHPILYSSYIFDTLLNEMIDFL